MITEFNKPAARVSDDGSCVLVCMRDPAGDGVREIELGGKAVVLPHPLMQPGVYHLPEWGLLFPAEMGINPANLLCNKDYTLMAEWAGPSWPPELKCYHRGTFTGLVSGHDIFQRFSGVEHFGMSTLSVPGTPEFSSPGMLALTTQERGPVIFGLKLPRYYAETAQIDIRTGKLTGSTRHGTLTEPLLAGLLILLAAGLWRWRELGVLFPPFNCHFDENQVRAAVMACLRRGGGRGARL
jgi:hypothetical protein